MRIETSEMTKQKLINMVAALVLTAVPVFSQTANKVIDWSKSPIGSNNERVAANLQLFRQIDGVEIEDIAVDGRSITVGEPFASGDDWLRSVTFRVKNVSGQRFERVQITIVLPQMGKESPDIAFCYGCTAAEKVKGINAGEVVELKMIDNGFYDWIRSRIAEKGSVSAITRAEIHHMYVTLPTGPTWFSGCVKTAHQKNACGRLAP